VLVRVQHQAIGMSTKVRIRTGDDKEAIMAAARK
jgi:hypothetical protein